jgi:outer membrane protein assembly factor BamA
MNKLHIVAILFLMTQLCWISTLENKLSCIFNKPICFKVLTCNSALSQDTNKEKKVKFLPVPAFGYSPETRTYIGAVTLITLNLYGDRSTRTSNAKFEFNYTWNKQIILESEWNYFFKGEKWFTKGKIHYSQYPDFYYGIGSDAPDANKLVYDSNRFIFEAFALKKIGAKLFTGFNVKHIVYAKIEPAISIINYPELAGSSIFAIGYSVLKDSRNSLLTPTKGAYIYLNAAYNFAKNNYWELTLDLRYYKTWQDKFTVASRFINDFNFGKPPFYDYAVLGGDKFVRGYYYGRYRDNNLSSWQSEFRFPVIWKFGLAVFGGVANIYSATNHFKFENLKYNYGLGIRFLVDKKDKTNLRLDYAVGQNNNNGFYVSFGESF